MTAGALIAEVDALRPNQYSAAQKLQWLQRLDGQVKLELEETHEPLPSASQTEQSGEESYTAETELRVPFPYDTELYSAYLFCQIDLHTGEISRYNQSLSLLSAAWRQAADWFNRQRLPKSRSGWQL